jgi:hypothetical protein
MKRDWTICAVSRPVTPRFRLSCVAKAAVNALDYTTLGPRGYMTDRLTVQSGMIQERILCADNE